MQVIPRISSKLTAPTLSGIMRREHLLKYLDSSTQPLVWIHAPGGSGKTTLVADWMDARNLEHIWLRLDASDSSPSTFFHHLILAARQAHSGLEVKLSNFTQEFSLDPISFSLNFFTELSNINPSSETILILDDYHEIDKNSPLHNIINKVLELTDADLKFIVLSRSSTPPEYIGTKVEGKLKTIEWSDIRFSLDDTCRLLEKDLNFHIPEIKAHEIYQSTEGWAAGIRLLTSNLSQKKSDILSFSNKEIVSNFLHHDSFDYFAHEIIQELSEEKKDFLFKTSLMPYFTSDMANQITGYSNSDTFLEFLVSSNLFIETHTGREKTFSYHPLFKNYLNKKLKETAEPSELKNLSKQAAALLNEIESYEESIDIYLDLREFNEAKKIIKNQSDEFISQGRIQQLSSWFDVLPDELLDKDPDLLFIYGRSMLISSTEKSCSMLLKAKDSYIAAENYSMALLAYGAYMEALAVAGKDYHLLEDCLYELEDILNKGTSEIQPAAESIASIVLFSTAFRTLNHPLQERWRRYAADAIENCTDPAALLKNCNNMMIYYRFLGEDRNNFHLMEILRPIRHQFSSVPLLKLQTQLIYAFHYGYVLSNGKEAEEICISSIEEGIKSGIRLYEFWFRYVLILSLLRDGKFSIANEKIRELRAQYTLLPPVRRADILTLSGLLSLYKQDYHQAIYDLKKAVEMYSEAGAFHSVHWASIILSLAHLEAGKPEKCRDILHNACSSDWLGSSYLEYHALCVEAWMEYKSNKSNTHTLEKAFKLAHRQDFVFIPLVGKRTFTKLCETALLHKIEPDYIRKIIAEHNLIPEDGSHLKHLWPCDFKIRTLGPFSIVDSRSEDEVEIELQQKPLALLKCIIANGGKNIPVDHICDILWQDSDGDAAYKSLKTTLYRLRKSLGGDHYIVTHNNTLSLSSTCCVDALSLWNIPSDINHGNLGIAIELANLFKAPFLEEDREESWTFLTRERINKNCQILLSNIARYFLAEGQEEKAISYFERAIEINVLEEDYYIALMRCYGSLKRHDRIESTYARHSEVCRALCGREPSERFEHSYRQLTGNRH